MAELSISYPVDIGTTGRFKTNTLFFSDESQIQFLFDTMRGERAIFKTFGNRLKRLIGMTRTKELDNRIKNAIIFDIKESLPNIKSLNVDVTYHPDERRYTAEILYSNRITGAEKQTKAFFSV